MKAFHVLCVGLVSFVAGCSTRPSAPPVNSSPVLTATRIKKDFAPDGDLAKSSWRSAPAVLVERGSRDGATRSALATTVRALWTDEFLYLAFDCPFTELTVFEPVQAHERFGLWERDVVEAFIGSDAANPRRYTEFEVSPTNERLDVKLPEKDFAWSSRFESATRIDRQRRRWTAEMRIPISELCDARPQHGTQWRINLYRCDYANKAFLALNPTLTGTFHTPERFGVLKFR